MGLQTLGPDLMARRWPHFSFHLLVGIARVRCISLFESGSVEVRSCRGQLDAWVADCLTMRPSFFRWLLSDANSSSCSSSVSASVCSQLRAAFWVVTCPDFRHCLLWVHVPHVMLRFTSHAVRLKPWYHMWRRRVACHSSHFATRRHACSSTQPMRSMALQFSLSLITRTQVSMVVSRTVFKPALGQSCSLAP